MIPRRAFAIAALCTAPLSCQPLTLDDAFLYDPTSAPDDGYHLSNTVIPHYENLTIPAPDGPKLHAVLVVSPGPRADITLVYWNGQGNIASAWERIEFLYPLGYNLVVVDPRGYGKSTGAPSESGIKADLRAVRAFLAHRAEIDDTRLVYYGRALGGAFAIDLAATNPPAVLITESTFTSVADLVKDSAYADVPRTFVAKSAWDSLAKMKSIPAPYLALAGTADSRFPVKYSDALVNAHPGKHQMTQVPGANQDNVPQTLGIPAYRQLLAGFIEAVIPPP